MATVFIPPTAPTVPAAVKPNHPGVQLFKHYRPWDAGINVWLMPGNVVTTAEPERESDALRVFHGGHIHPVSTAEAAALTAAGYVVVELVLPVPTAPLPGFEDVGSPNVAPPGFGFGSFGTTPFGGTP